MAIEGKRRLRYLPTEDQRAMLKELAEKREATKVGYRALVAEFLGKFPGVPMRDIHVLNHLWGLTYKARLQTKKKNAAPNSAVTIPHDTPSPAQADDAQSDQATQIAAQPSSSIAHPSDALRVVAEAVRELRDSFERAAVTIRGERDELLASKDAEIATLRSYVAHLSRQVGAA